MKERISFNLKYLFLTGMSFCSSFGAIYGEVAIVKVVFLFLILLYATISMKSNHFFLKLRRGHILLFVSIFFSCLLSRFETLSLLLSFLVALFSRGLNERKIVIFLFIPRILLFILNFILLGCGIIPNEIIFRYEYGSLIVDNVRYCLGFFHPNTAYWYYFTLATQYVFIRSKRIKLSEIFFLFGIAYYLFILTDSRTGFIAMILLILLSIVHKFHECIIIFLTRKRILMFAILVTLSIGITIPIYFARGGNNQVLTKMDFLFTGRFSSAALGLSVEGFSLFGKIRSFNNVLDSTYIYLLVYTGIITFLLLIYNYYILIKKLEYKGKYFHICLILLYMIYALFEHPFINIFNNFTIFFFCIQYENIKKYSRTVKTKK